MKASPRSNGAEVQVVLFKTLCVSEGLPEPIPEFKFHPKRNWRIDFYFEQDGIRCALEVEGGIYQYGRHNRIGGYLKDLEKYNQLAVCRIFLVRVTPQNLLRMNTINLIKSVLKPEENGIQ